TGDLWFAYDPTNQTGATIAYTNFNSANGMNLVGDATLSGGALRLTPILDAAGHFGSAWLQAKQPISAGFDTSFQFRITNTGGAGPGADGFSFTVQNISPTTANSFANQDPFASNNVTVFF